jgi:hypothetical protein
LNGTRIPRDSRAFKNVWVTLFFYLNRENMTHKISYALENYPFLGSKDAPKF